MSSSLVTTNPLPKRPRPYESRRDFITRVLMFAFLAVFLGCQPNPTPVAESSQPAVENEPSPVPGDSAEPKVLGTKPSPEIAEAASPTAVNGEPPASETKETAGENSSDAPKAAPAEPEMATADASVEPSELGGPLTTAELDEEYVPDPEIMAEIEAQQKALRRIADTYDAPPGTAQLGEEPDLWVDMEAKRIYVDGYVSMRRGPLEMLACPIGTKEHESVIALFAKSSEVHAALLAIGAQSGTTARWDPEFLPPTGQTVLVWVTYREPKDDAVTDDNDRYRPFFPSDEFKVVDAREWVRNVETQKALEEPWVFAGSEFWKDPEENIEHYSANAGDMICVSNFSTAMMDVPFASSADAGSTLFEPFEEAIPDPGTPVRLVLVPQPIPGADPTPVFKVDPKRSPQEAILPINQELTQSKDDSKG